MKKIFIAPSLLSSNIARLSEAVQLVRKDADYIHCDVMDGHFVPNLTFGSPVIKALKQETGIPLDVHLMIENPGKWIYDYLNAGLDSNDYLTIHVEAESEPVKVLKEIRRQGVKSGLAIKPGTSFSRVYDALEFADQLLIMTVEPGFGGQKFISKMIPRIEKACRCITKCQVIGVDGGINRETISLAVNAGADLIVAGGAVYGTNDPAGAIKTLRAAAACF